MAAGTLKLVGKRLKTTPVGSTLHNFFDYCTELQKHAMQLSERESMIHMRRFQRLTDTMVKLTKLVKLSE
jgi:hypothetical protein